MRKFMLRRLGVADDPGHLQPSLQACLEVVLEQGPQLVEQVLAGLSQAIQPIQGKPSAAAADPVLCKTIKELQEDAPALKQSFSQHLRSQVFAGQSGRQAARQMLRFEDFQFLDASQIDANIEFAQSLQSVQLAVQDVLPTLNALISHLLGWSSVLSHLNPLKPDAFVHALRESLQECVPEPAARASVMGLAAGLLGASLQHLYREVNQWLRSLGVEPVHMPTHASTGMWNPENAAQSTVARTMLSLDKLRRLLSGELDPNPVAGARLDYAHTIPASFEALQDMKLVEPLMKRLSDRASKTVAAVLKIAEPEPAVVDMLANDDEPTQRKKLGAQLGREVVLLMLDNLMQDSRLLPGVRASLKALEPELLRLSQQDGRLFSERQHPARLFLDRMTHRSLAFSRADAPGYAHFQTAFDEAVSQIKASAGDAAAFRKVLVSLEENWGLEEADQHKRAMQAARGLLQAEQRNLLAQRLSQEFAERLRDLDLPEMVVGFLRGPWAQVVAQAQINFADGSADPGGYLGLVDDLIWSVQLRLTRRNRARLVQMVPDMLVTMRRGLELISYPSKRMADFFDALISFHEQVFENSRPGALTALQDTPAGQQVAAAEAPTAAAQLWIGDAEAADSGYLDEEIVLVPPEPQPRAEPVDQAIWTVDSLGTGTWVDLALAGNWVRAQLTWTSPQRTLFMFISGSGMAHSMSRKTIERLKKSRLIRLVSDGRVMDNALDAVAQTALRNDLREAGPKAAK
jgi:hypothetical protein